MNLPTYKCQVNVINDTNVGRPLAKSLLMSCDFGADKGTGGGLVSIDRILVKTRLLFLGEKIPKTRWTWVGLPNPCSKPRASKIATSRCSTHGYHDIVCALIRLSAQSDPKAPSISPPLGRLAGGQPRQAYACPCKLLLHALWRIWLTCHPFLLLVALRWLAAHPHPPALGTLHRCADCSTSQTCLQWCLLILPRPGAYCLEGTSQCASSCWPHMSPCWLDTRCPCKSFLFSRINKLTAKVGQSWLCVHDPDVTHF